ncbi:uncharacterized membrane protein YciS (DUF1049 family) [Spelaeicoccus albus]|uniref:Uncharacterized membrane protein YciS (DUF1049 family) n=1 Tax=Spelaeicoccus albus TaxID=1280376 RepID=A0A7Z0A9L6_9MICO|nr:uncharacterized membrane protein YciS (DUF1049 family) [Spelaeicoccus albus]
MSIIMFIVGFAIAVLVVPPSLQRKVQKSSRRMIRRLAKSTKNKGDSRS